MTWQPLTAVETQALALSVKVALASVLVALPPGIAVAWLLARKSFVGKSVVEGLVQLPLVLPPVVTGYVLLVWLGDNGPIGRMLQGIFGVSLAFNWLGAVVAAVVVGFPLLVRPARLAFESVDRRLEQASHTLGRGPGGTFFRVSLPLALPGVVTGTLLCFARALGEFGATIVFVGNISGQTRTLPLAIYTAVQSPGGEAAATRLVVVAIALSFATVLAGEWIRKRILARRAEWA